MIVRSNFTLQADRYEPVERQRQIARNDHARFRISS